MNGQALLAPSEGWSKARIESLLAAESFDYQSVPLPHGLKTDGHDRSRTAELILPHDLKGESVLDVGSSLGFFCQVAKRRGARRVTALDLEPENIRKSALLAEINGLEIEHIHGNIETGAITEAYDHVLCLNVIHHMSDPIAGIDRLTALARKRLVLELATIGAHDRGKLGLSWLSRFFFAKLPAIIVGQGTAAEGIKQYYLTEKAIENLLRFRRGCFASVKLLPSEFKERFIVIAEKRQIGRLLVLAGPSSFGTGELLEMLRNNKGAAFAKQLKLSSSEGLGAVIRAEQYTIPVDACVEKQTLIYDLMRPFATGAVEYQYDPALDILDCAQAVDAITVWIEPDMLAARVAAEERTSKGRLKKRWSRLLREYREPSRVIDHYQHWLAYCSARKLKPKIVSLVGAEPKILDLGEWRKSIGAA